MNLPLIDAATANAPPRTLVTLAGLFLVAALAMQAVQVAATYVSELVGSTATNRLSSTSITSGCETRRLSCALFTH